MADVFGTQEPSPGPIKYALAATSGRRRTGALTDSQAEGRGFESPFPLQASPRVCVHDHRVPQMANVDFHNCHVLIRIEKYIGFLYPGPLKFHPIADLNVDLF